MGIRKEQLETQVQNELNQAASSVQPADIADFESIAELNARDTANRDRANHTGTQTASTISDFDTEVSNNTDVAANTAKNSYPSADQTKVGFLTVTQAVDLDTIESRVNALDAAVVLKGSWDASAGTFPGGGSSQAGESYIVSVAGTVDSIEFNVNDRIVAITDNASTTTYASNWLKLDYTDEVLSVAGKTGAVTLEHDDITDFDTGVSTNSAVAANTAKVGVTTEISNVVEDTTPQLGGNLDAQGNDITGVNMLEAFAGGLAGDTFSDVVVTQDLFVTKGIISSIEGNNLTWAYENYTTSYTGVTNGDRAFEPGDKFATLTADPAIFEITGTDIATSSNINDRCILIQAHKNFDGFNVKIEIKKQSDSTYYTLSDEVANLSKDGYYPSPAFSSVIGNGEQISGIKVTFSSFTPNSFVKQIGVYNPRGMNEEAFTFLPRNGGTMFGEITTPSGQLISATSFDTLANKRYQRRTHNFVTAAGITPSLFIADMVIFTALAANLTIFAPGGSPLNGEKLMFRFKDDGTSRTLTWNAIYRGIGVTIPTSTTTNKTLYVEAIYNEEDVKWDVIAVAEEA